jgi:hypothetical protein
MDFYLFSAALSIEKLTVKIPDLPKSMHGFKIVQMSDLHYDGVRLSEEILEQAITFTNKAKPDLICLTGDYISYSPTPIHQLALRLKKLESRFGIYAVLGNHDLYKTGAKEEVINALTGIDVKVLWNEISYPFGEGLAVVGLADYWSKEFNPASVLDNFDPTIPRIVLSHNPDTAEILKQWRVDLQLSGHTHGGQIVIPGFGSILRLSKLQSQIRSQIPRKIRRKIPFMGGDFTRVVGNWRWSEGFHKVGNNQLYVNRGLGSYEPGRLFCPPEVTIITLDIG